MRLQRLARSAAAVLGQDSALVKSARPFYQRSLVWLTGDRGVPWTLNGVPFRIGARQRHRMGEIYDPEVAAFLASHIRPGSICFDVGANVGVYALQFAQWTGPSGRVVAFEPNPVSAGALAEHIRMNGFSNRVTVVEAAVADQAGIATFHMADADGMSRLGAPNPEIASLTRPVSVTVTTVDDYCAVEGADPEWLLIDVEGFEFAVLSGARATFARLGERLNVIVEMHPNAWSVSGWSRAAAESLLDSLGVVPVPLSGQADPLGDYGHVLLQQPGAPIPVSLAGPPVEPTSLP